MDKSLLRHLYADTSGVNATVRALVARAVCRLYMVDYCALGAYLPPSACPEGMRFDAAACAARGFRSADLRSSLHVAGL